MICLWCGRSMNKRHEAVGEKRSMISYIIVDSSLISLAHNKQFIKVLCNECSDEIKKKAGELTKGEISDKRKIQK